jgi:hypothetical protein
MAETAVRALLARWERDVANLHAANEDEGHAVAAIARAARAEEIWRCLAELREALSAPETPSPAPSPVSAATGETAGLSTTTEETR